MASSRQFLSICQSAKLHACSLHKLRLVHTLVQSCEHASGNQESHLLEFELRFPLWYQFSRYPGIISTDEHIIHMKQQNTFGHTALGIVYHQSAPRGSAQKKKYQSLDASRCPGRHLRIMKSGPSRYTLRGKGCDTCKNAPETSTVAKTASLMKPSENAKLGKSFTTEELLARLKTSSLYDRKFKSLPTVQQALISSSRQDRISINQPGQLQLPFSSSRCEPS